MKIGTLTIHLKQFKKSFLLAFAIALLLGASSACKDKTNNQNMSPCNTNPGSCKSVLESKDLFLFKVGSFWVYEEETSHERDSMYVTSYVNEETGYDFDVYLQSSLSGYTYHYWPTYYGNIAGCNQQGPVIQKCLYVNRAKFKFQDHLGESEIFFVNYNLGESITSGSDMYYCPNNHVTIGELLDTLILGGTTFFDVVRVDQNCEFAEGKQPTKFYYSKNIGVIRKELIDSNQVWNLVNYHVIQ